MKKRKRKIMMNDKATVIFHMHNLIVGMNERDIENFREYNELPFPKPCFNYNEGCPVIMNFLLRLIERINRTGFVKIDAVVPEQSEDDPLGRHFKIVISNRQRKLK